MATEISDIDFQQLEAYLQAAVSYPVADIQVLSDGLNLMLGVSTQEGGLTYVLRRPTKLRDTDLFTDLAVEYEILHELESTAVPAPRPIHFCADRTILGEQFYVMSALEGDGIDWGDPLPDRFENPSDRRRMGEVLVDGLGEIHTLPAEPFVDTCPIQTPNEQLEIAQDRLASICEILGRDFPRLSRVGERLGRMAPARSRTRLIHGDYKPDNVFFGEAGTPQLTGIVDWETSMLGDPLIEVGYLLLLWRDRTGATKSLSKLQKKAPSAAVSDYLAAVEASGFWPFTLDEDTLTRRDILDRYEEATGFAYEKDGFYQAFSAYMLGVVWSDLYRYDLESGTEREEPGYITGIAMIAEDIIDNPPRL